MSRDINYEKGRFKEGIIIIIIVKSRSTWTKWTYKLSNVILSQYFTNTLRNNPITFFWLITLFKMTQQNARSISKNRTYQVWAPTTWRKMKQESRKVAFFLYCIWATFVLVLYSLLPYLSGIEKMQIHFPELNIRQKDSSQLSQKNPHPSSSN